MLNSPLLLLLRHGQTDTTYTHTLSEGARMSTATFIMKPYCSLYYVSSSSVARYYPQKFQSWRGYSPLHRRKTRPRYTCGLECAERVCLAASVLASELSGVTPSARVRVIVMTARLISLLLCLSPSHIKSKLGLLRCFPSHSSLTYDISAAQITVRRCQTRPSHPHPRGIPHMTSAQKWERGSKNTPNLRTNST